MLSRWRPTCWRSAVALAGVAAGCAAILPGATADAAPASSTPPGLQAVLNKANALSDQIDNLSEQYDGLKVQLGQARAELAIARENAAQDRKLFLQDQASIGQIAAENYMTGGISPALQMLQSATPQSLLNSASILTELQDENGTKISLVATAEYAAQRAQGAASQEQQRAKVLTAAMAAKVAQIQQKENFFNSEAFKQAEAIFQQTGSYPPIHVNGDSIGVQALRFALTRIGDPYVWGGAGPYDFDCSGLVVWAYAQVGITLEHYTGDLWNEVEHIPVSELEPGDLVFFYANASHVGIYVGDGEMVDAPTFGQDVQIQPVMYNVLVGAGEVVG